MQTINDRFKIIVEKWYRGNDLAFAKSMGKFSSSFSKIINGTVNPRATTLQRVCESLPQLNPTWLLMGEGDMERSEDKAQSAHDTKNNKDLLLMAKTEEIKAKDELIATLKQYVEDLRKMHAE